MAIKEAIKTFGYDENENIAIPTIIIGGDGKIGGTKWTVLGKTSKKITIKGMQLWPECEDDVHITLEVPEFYNNFNKFPLAAMGVLAPGSAHA